MISKISSNPDHSMILCTIFKLTALKFLLNWLVVAL